MSNTPVPMERMGAMDAVVAMSPDAIRIAECEHVLEGAPQLAPTSAGSLVPDTSTALLRTIAEALDIRSVFPRVSEIVKHVLPYDALILVLFDRTGQVTLEVRSSEGLPKHGWLASGDDTDHTIVGDLRKGSRLTACEPAIVDALVAAGYRSVLSVRGRALSQVLRLGFVSKQAEAYAQSDVAAAHHVADYVAMAVAHEQLAAAERDRAEARGRSDRVDARVRTLIEKGEVVPAHGPMIGRSETWQRVLTRALRVAPTDATVFLQGESGTGKEVVSRFIRRPRRARTDRSSPSTARRFRNSCSNRSSLATSVGVVSKNCADLSSDRF